MARSDCGPNKKNKAGVFKGRRWVPVIIAGLILGLCCWDVLAAAKSSLPMPFGTGAAVVLSGSMSPALEVDDLIIIQEKEQYEVGDIVVYETGSSPVVHRIIAIDGSLVTTKGDANNTADTPVDIGAIKGKVIMRVPFLGAVINILKLPAVGILVLAGVGVLLWQSFRTEKSPEEEDLDEVKDEIQRLKAELDFENQDSSDGKAG